jgi:hypothetical protein
MTDKAIKRMQELAGIRKVSSPKYKVIFYDYGDDEYPIDEIFNSRMEAMDFAESGMWEEDYDYIGNDGEDHFATRNRYYNKDYDENFFSYTIEEV